MTIVWGAVIASGSALLAACVVAFFQGKKIGERDRMLSWAHGLLDDVMEYDGWEMEASKWVRTYEEWEDRDEQ